MKTPGRKDKLTQRRCPQDAQAEAATDPKLTVYFDGACPLCSVEIGHYATREGAGRLRFVDVSEPGADPGAELTREAALQRFHVRLPDGSLASGAAGFVALWDRLPGWQRAARLARIPGMMALLEGGYRLFLPLRPALARIAGWLGAKPARGTGKRR